MLRWRTQTFSNTQIKNFFNTYSYFKATVQIVPSIDAKAKYWLDKQEIDWLEKQAIN